MIDRRLFLAASGPALVADLHEVLKAAFIDAMMTIKDVAPEVWKTFTDGEVIRFAPPGTKTTRMW